MSTQPHRRGFALSLWGGVLFFVDVILWLLYLFGYPKFTYTRYIGNSSYQAIDFGRSNTYLAFLAGLMILGALLMSLGSHSRQTAIMSQLCSICSHPIVRSSYFFSGIQTPAPYFHESCYREILRGQRRRCLNCNLPLYNPKSREFVVPVVIDERKQFFCSTKCSEAYEPLAGLAVSLPTEVACPYCKSVYSASLTKCPRCGAARTKPTPDLMGLNPYQFEQKVAELLVRMGYSNVARVGGAGDRAVDITAQRKDEFGQVLRYAVQCKRYDASSHVGSTEMQVFCSMISRVHRSDRGIYVTTASFTPEAAEIARKFGVTLVDGKLLQELLVQYG